MCAWPRLLDGKPTDVFVLVLARDERTHLLLVAGLSRLVREASVLRVMRNSQPARQIIRMIRETKNRLFDQSSVA
jgi:hypothetical protein